MTPADPVPPVTPRDEPLCPLCGGPNGCAAARSGSFETPCWCADGVFRPEVLERVPADRRGQACLCRACATS